MTIIITAAVHVHVLFSDQKLVTKSASKNVDLEPYMLLAEEVKVQFLISRFIVVTGGFSTFGSFFKCTRAVKLVTILP